MPFFDLRLCDASLVNVNCDPRVLVASRRVRDYPRLQMRELAVGLVTLSVVSVRVNVSSPQSRRLPRKRVLLAEVSPGVHEVRPAPAGAVRRASDEVGDRGIRPSEGEGTPHLSRVGVDSRPKVELTQVSPAPPPPIAHRQEHAIGIRDGLLDRIPAVVVLALLRQLAGGEHVLGHRL